MNGKSELELEITNNKNRLPKLNADDRRSNHKDSRTHTADIIYESYIQKRFEGFQRRKIIVLVSILLTFSAVYSIALFQYDEYISYLNKRDDYINKTVKFCNLVDLANIDIIMTPYAIIMIIVYVILYKRRVLWKNKYKYRNFGLPMIVSCWNKTNRFYTSITYGLIAFNIFNIVKNSFKSKLNSRKLLNFSDPTGLIPLIIKIVEVLLVGIRYFPVLNAFRTNSFILNLTSAVYMWIDFLENIYQYGRCESVIADLMSPEDIVNLNLNLYIAYKVLTAIPLSLFSSFIVISLSYRSFICIVNFIYTNNSTRNKKIMINKTKDSFCCSLFNIDDDDEIIYSKYDLDYVYNLLNAKKPTKKESREPSKSSFISENDDQIQMVNDSLANIKFKMYNRIYLRMKKDGMEKVSTFFTKHVYKWDCDFRFTSRFLNTIIVAVIALYYFFLFWCFTVFTISAKLTSKSLNYESLVENICELTEELCPKQMHVFEEMAKFIYEGFNSTLNKEPMNYDAFRYSIHTSLIVPIFVSFLICLTQLFLLVRDCKIHLTQLYKGECEFVNKSKNLKNSKIAGSSFHFAGYLIGYLIWGYFIIYIFCTLIGIVISLANTNVGKRSLSELVSKCVPFIIAFIVKKILNSLAAKFVFLNRNSKILALNNFRAFNVFLYFNFYFDCFMGFLSAIVRLIKATVSALIMMPRISYSFLGRHLEKYDNGYGCYSGFLHMEAMHTNPIIVTFCSLLYYKELSEHIRLYATKCRINLNDRNYRIELPEFIGRISQQIENINSQILIKKIKEENNENNKKPFKKYNKILVNRWHVCLRLNLNKELIRYRKNNEKTLNETTTPNEINKIDNNNNEDSFACEKIESRKPSSNLSLNNFNLKKSNIFNMLNKIEAIK